MKSIGALETLRSSGAMAWAPREHGWLANPDEIVQALAREGFQECKREVVRTRRGHEPAGGLWQGLHEGTGAVGSAIWVHHADRALVFIEVDGEPIADDAASSPDSS
jgi:hypothetical protein